MNNIFKLKTNGRGFHDKYKLNLDIPKWNQKTFGYKASRYYALKSGTVYQTMLNSLKTLILSKSVKKLGWKLV